MDCTDVWDSVELLHMSYDHINDREPDVCHQTVGSGSSVRLTRHDVGDVVSFPADDTNRSLKYK